jgi:caffeoyl-CoA O-methyltransferase
MSHPSDAPLHILHPDVRGYIAALASTGDDPLIARLADHAMATNFPLIGRSSGGWLELLTRIIGGKRVFEFGSGFGYSAYFFARGVGVGGEVIGSEKDAHELDAHRRLFDGHPLADRIRIELGGAFEVFDAQPGIFDLVLIDIDKANYPRALEAAIPRVRPGGLILADNVLWGGKTARPAAADDASTTALQQFNRMLVADRRIRTEILPCGDGLSVSLRLPDDA